MEKFQSLVLSVIILGSLGGIFYITVINSRDDQTGPIRRYSNHTNGIDVIKNYEARNHNQEAFEINSTNNEIVANWGCTINEDSISGVGNDDLYLAYSWHFESTSIDNDTLRQLLINEKKLHEHAHAPVFDSIDRWTINRMTVSGNLEDLSFSSGWIIYQKLDVGTVTGPLSGQGELSQAFSILDLEMSMIFYAQSCGFWIA